MKKRFFLLIVLCFLSLLATPAFAGDAPLPHTVAALNSEEVAGSAEVVYFNERLIVLYSRSFDKKLVLQSYKLTGNIESIQTFKGDAQAAQPQGIRADSDGKTLAFVWREEVDFGTKLFVAATTDGVNFNQICVDSGVYFSVADVAVKGNNIVVVYRRNNNLYARKSTDGGLTFSAPETVFSGDDPNRDRVYQVEAEISDSNLIGVGFAFEDYTGEDAYGNPIYQKSIYFAESNFSSTTWTYVKVYNNDAEVPDTSNFHRPLSLAFDDAGNPWLVWCSRSNTGKIFWIKRSGSAWQTATSFSSSNSQTSSVKLLSNRALYSPGLMLLYTKGANTKVYYRFFSSSNIGSEKEFSQIGSNNIAFLSADTFFGHVAVLTIKISQNNIQDLVLNFEEILVPGRTGKLRYRIWSEDFENSNVNGDGYWQITTDQNSAGAKFAETSNYYYSGTKSLWSVGIGNVNGGYPSNTATTAKLKFYSPTSLNYELYFMYRLSTANEGDQASAGFSSNPLIVQPNYNVWSSYRSYSSNAETMTQFRFVSDDTQNDLGFLIDDLNIYGYRLKRPTISISKENVGGIEKVRIMVSNYEGSYFYVFRSSNNVDFSLVATSTSNTILDLPANTGYYYYFVCTSNNEFESPPSNVLSVFVDRNKPIINIYGVEDGGIYTSTVTPQIKFIDFESGIQEATYTLTMNSVPIPWTSGKPIGEEGIYVLSATARDKSGNTSTKTVTFTINIPPRWDRISGADRYQTAVELSKNFFPTGADTVVIATGENFPDALAAAPLAKAYSAPLLLVKKDSIPNVVREEIVRLGTRNAIIIGGVGAISSNVEEALKNNLNLSVLRIGGKDRYETSKLIAEALAKKLGATSFERAYVATGENFADALSAAPLAAYELCPILLVKKDSIPEPIFSFIFSYRIQKTVVLGGEGVISSAVQGLLPNPTRLWGINRYITNLEIVKYALNTLSFRNDIVYIATGENFPDALSSGASVSLIPSALLLVPKTTPFSKNVETFLYLNKQINEVHFVGGEGAVPSSVADYIVNLLSR